MGDLVEVDKLSSASILLAADSPYLVRGSALGHILQRRDKINASIAWGG